jgi:hypothetical protein
MKPRNHVALAMLRAPQVTPQVTPQVGFHRKDIDMAIDMEDVPCFKVTVEVYVTGDDAERAQEHIAAALMARKQVDECDIFDWNFVDTEET